jgi:hypothetical protein
LAFLLFLNLTSAIVESTTLEATYLFKICMVRFLCVIQSSFFSRFIWITDTRPIKTCWLQ